MSLSAKWTAVSLFALSALGAGLLAAGCTVTSGNPDNTEGGTGNNPPVEAGASDTSTADTSTPGNACPGNTKQTTKFAPAACQAATEKDCCNELIACFDIPGVAAAEDCNVYAACLADCAKPADDGAAPTTQEIDQCQTDLCDTNSPSSVQMAHAALISCQTTKTDVSAACQ
jgi:hypothetical protein